MISPEVLRRYPFFCCLNEEQQRAIALVTEEMRVDVGKELFVEGQPVEALYLLVEGSVDLYYAASGDPKDQLLVGDDDHDRPVADLDRSRPEAGRGRFSPRGERPRAAGALQHPTDDFPGRPTGPADEHGEGARRAERVPQRRLLRLDDGGPAYLLESVEGGERKRLNQELMLTPIFRDSAIEQDRRYVYQVTAVDLTNNESAPSEEVLIETH